MPRERNYSGPAVLFHNCPVLHPAGKCSVLDCRRPARYTLTNFYMCQQHLIEMTEHGEIPRGAVIHRVTERSA